MELARILVVGCGSIGRRHASQLIRRNDIRLELCDPMADNLAKAIADVGNVPTYHSFDEAIATRPEFVIVATPHSLHAEQSIKALRAGAHVLCEKPMSDSLVDAERMIEAAKETGKILDIGFTMHFYPAIIRVKELIDAGRLGQVLHVHWHVGTFDTLANSVSRHQSEVFGALIMDYAHQPDLIHYWLGKTPTRVRSFGIQGGELPFTSNPNVMTLVLEYPEALLATINLNYVQRPQRAHCEIIGDKGWSYLNLQTGCLKIGDREGSSVEKLHFDVDRDAWFRDEHQAFIDATQGLRQPESPSWQAIHSMRIVEAAIKSLQSATPVEV